jgi:serine protease Do
MKVQIFFPLMCSGLFLWPGGGVLLGSESVQDLGDLAVLESRVQQVSKNAMPATVALLSEETGSSGSGVIATAEGLILTAAHVVQGADEILVVFPDGRQVPGVVLGANYSKDIAMVRIKEKGQWPFVEMGSSKPLVAGDWVIALGHSAGFDAGRTPPVRFGRVVSKGPGNFLTTDCTLIGGDSGGPLFDLEGKIVGINSSIGLSLTNNNHAGIDGFKDDWKRMLAGEAWGKLSMNPLANPEMPVLGIEMGLLRRGKGVPVVGVVAQSPSAAAGVRIGDVIESMDGTDIADGNVLLQVLAKKQAGDQVKLGVRRESRSLVLEVKLARREALFEFEER